LELRQGAREREIVAVEHGLSFPARILHLVALGVTPIGTIRTIQKQLEVLKRFEGGRWREKQKAYLDALGAKGLSKATTKDKDNQGTPMSRMLAQVFSTLGFAWINQDEAVTLTPAGECFVQAKDPGEIVAVQSQRYQISNPMAGGKATEDIEVHPVAFLLEVLLKTESLTPFEYTLFCAKARDFSYIDDTVENILQWRKLGPIYQKTIINALERVKIGKPEKKLAAAPYTIPLTLIHRTHWPSGQLHVSSSRCRRMERRRYVSRAKNYRRQRPS